MVANLKTVCNVGLPVQWESTLLSLIQMIYVTINIYSTSVYVNREHCKIYKKYKLTERVCKALDRNVFIFIINHITCDNKAIMCRCIIKLEKHILLV